MKQPSNASVVAAIKSYLGRAAAEGDAAVIRALTLALVRHNRSLAEWHLWNEADRRCMAGPFAGMQLHDGWLWCLGPCLLGTYESEIVGWIEDLVAARPPLVVDVGAGDGYYAVGLAMRLPDARVIAADSDPRARAGTAAQATLNGVADRVRVIGEVGPAELQAMLAPAPGAVVLSDCEGYEDRLLDPILVPALRETTIVVELHDFAVAGVAGRIRERFEATHAVELRRAEMRDGLAVPPILDLPPFLRYLAVDEGRPAMQWARLTPKGS